ncbi:MAG: Holliday junction resolvase RuvX [Candidatus Peribacteria bacterium]|nr:MAG: Holliday junction resolvase RuvX [Candidatus Peribacteria bacterium]
MRQKSKNTLGVDWGSKYIGLAYEQGDTHIVFPIGYIINDKDFVRQFGQFLVQYHVGHIVVGWPKEQHIQDQVKSFVEQITSVAGDDIIIELTDEEYSSVQAGERSGNFQKNIMEDTLAAMIILERRREKNNTKTE